MVYHRLSDLDFSLDALPVMRHPQSVLMTSPDHFDVTYVINAHIE